MSLERELSESSIAIYSLCKTLSTLPLPLSLDEHDLCFLAGVMCSPTGKFVTDVHPHILVVVKPEGVHIVHRLHQAFGGEIILGPKQHFIYSLSDINTLLNSLSSPSFQRFLSPKVRTLAANFLISILDLFN